MARTRVEECYLTNFQFSQLSDSTLLRVKVTSKTGAGVWIKATVDDIATIRRSDKFIRKAN